MNLETAIKDLNLILDNVMEQFIPNTEKIVSIIPKEILEKIRNDLKSVSMITPRKFRVCRHYPTMASQKQEYYTVHTKESNMISIHQDGGSTEIIEVEEIINGGGYVNKY